MSLTFAEPACFWLLLLLPVLPLLKAAADARSRRATRRVAADRLLPGLLVRHRPWRGWLVLSLELLALAFFVAALARPRFGTTTEETPGSGRNVIIALDTSRSMLATDLEPNRLERAKLVVVDLVKRLRGDRIALLPFAGSAFLYAPLTNDTDALLDSMDLMDEEIIPREGSNIARAVDLAVETYEESGISGQMALILLSDGEELEGEAIEAARRARERNITIVTIGIGTEKGGVIPDPDAPGGYHRDRNGKVVFTKLERDVLIRLANQTGGLYLPLGPSVAGDQGIAMILEKLQRTSMKGKITERPVDRFRWPLTAGLLSLLAAFLTGILRRHRAPRLPRAATAAAAVAAAVLIAAPRAEAAEERPVGDPWKLYEAGDYEGAASNFDRRLEGAGERERPRLEAGRGAAAFRTRDWDTAVDAFGGALLDPDVRRRSDAHYNLANSIYQRAKESAESARPEDVNLEFLDSLIRQLENSLEHYQQALLLDPDSADAAGNHDITDRLIQELRNLRQQQQQQQQQGGEGQGQPQDGDGQSGDRSQGGSNDGQSGSGSPDSQGGGGENDRDGDGADRNRQSDIGSGESEEERRAREDSNRERDGDIGTRGENPSGQAGDGDRREDDPGRGEGEGDEPREGSQSNSADNRVNPRTGFSPAEARREMKRFSDEDFSVRRFSDERPQFQPLKDW